MTKASTFKKPTITYANDPYQEYLDKEDYIGSYALSCFMASPRTYLFERSKGEPNTKHYQIIEAAYDLIIGTKPFDKKYARLPKYDRRTVIGKAEYKNFMDQNEDKIVLTEEEYDLVSEVGAYMLNSSWLPDLLRSSHFDMSAYTTDPITGINIKMRPALYSLDKKTLIDTKIAYKRSNLLDFIPQHAEYDYDLSIGLCSLMLPCEKIMTLAIEEKAPYSSSLFGYSEKSIQHAQQRTRLALDMLKWSMDNNYWCNHSEFEILKNCFLTKKQNKALEIIQKSEQVSNIEI